MTEKQLIKFQKRITKEINEYKDKMLKQSTEYVYLNSFEILVNEELYCYLLNNAEDMDYNFFPKQNILEILSKRFMKSGAQLTDDDILDFFYYATENSENEM